MRCIHEWAAGVRCPDDAITGSHYCAAHAIARAASLPAAVEDWKQRYRTPRLLGRNLIEEFGCNHDAAADESNHLCPTYWSRENSALERRWHPLVRPWDNPPFGIAEQFAGKHEEHKAAGGVSVLLVIDRCTKWLQKVKRENVYWEFKARVEYELPDDAPANALTNQVTFGSVLVLFDAALEPRMAGWRDEVTGGIVEAR